MRLITVRLEKIKSNFYAKIPSVIADSLHLKSNEEIEISIHSEPMFAQGSFWDEPFNDIDSIQLDLSKDIHTINKYNKLYIPQKFRFFFPKTGSDFILNTNIGNIRTHITASGYFSAGMQGWFKINGPIDFNDKISIKSLDDDKFNYELIYIDD